MNSEHKTRAATVAMLYQGGAQSLKDNIPAKVAMLYRSQGINLWFNYEGEIFRAAMLHPKISYI